MRQHGTRTKYVHDGCRCLPCRAANANYSTANVRARQQGRIRLVDASPARDHVRNLMDAGMGWKRVAAAAGVSTGAMAKLLGYGNHTPSARVRPETARKILAVRTQLADHATVDANDTWHKIDDLLALGHTKKAIGRYVTGNPNARSLQIGRDRVLKTTADRIHLLWSHVTRRAA